MGLLKCCVVGGGGAGWGSGRLLRRCSARPYVMEPPPCWPPILGPLSRRLLGKPSLVSIWNLLG